MLKFSGKESIKIIILSAISIFLSQCAEVCLNPGLKCVGCPYYNVSLTAYYPDYASDDSSDYLDMRGKKLKTLQDFLDGRDEYVTAAMDKNPEIPYGTRVCIPELNQHFKQYIPIQVRDYSPDLEGEGHSSVDICVRSESDSYDFAVNRMVTLYIREDAKNNNNEN
ncbi:uncharacterized protein LOC103579089 [Microplitis demolitor]|uniref:uncharacterized protein LOC103579089 n=1 Tax=Microplitis demolitor TaxID=69319 RepID=UPI0004CD0705|nr:uncharacterized protein LOC103579089 [Microplitis demolitor]